MAIKIPPILFLLFLITACSGDYDYVRFETPQPEGVKTIFSFGKKIQGKYRHCSRPDEELQIGENTIVNNRNNHFTVHRNDLILDSGSTLNRQNNDELTHLLEAEGYQINISGDSIRGTQTDMDTIFAISRNQLIKKFKGSYFLNIKSGEQFWTVRQLDIHHDTLFISEIFPSDSLLRFNFVTKNSEVNANDSSNITEYSIKPSKKEFKKLLRPGSFETMACYCKKKDPLVVTDDSSKLTNDQSTQPILLKQRGT